MAYRDDGAGALVIATLKRVHIGTGTFGGTIGKLDVLSTIDSDAHPTSDNMAPPSHRLTGLQPVAIITPCPLQASHHRPHWLRCQF